MDTAKVQCSICHGSTAGNGRGGILIAECGHSFHMNCIAVNQTKVCPTCGFMWNPLYPAQPTQPVNPFHPLRNPNPMNSYHPYHNPNPTFRLIPFLVPYQHDSGYYEPQNFSDDDPLLPIPTTASTTNNNQQRVTIQSHTEYPAIPASESSSNFALLVRAIAPPSTSSGSGGGRSPIDLVLVLDVSGSMGGQPLNLLKQAVRFVIDNLGVNDRLSIVTFSTVADRVFRLMRMTDTGKQNAINMVNSLLASGSTDILAGLLKGIRVLQQRRERNPVGSVVLLSDGQDNATQRGVGFGFGSSLTSIITAAADAASGLGIPIHTFGFGSQHDARLLHGLAESMDGTFSFIESIETVSVAFARCIGGLLSVVAQNVTITMRTPSSSGVKIVRIPAGRCGSEVKNCGTEGVIKVGMLYAHEEKKFLVYLNVPTVDDRHHQEDHEMVVLDMVRCEYNEPEAEAGAGMVITVEGETVKIQRPSMLSGAEPNPDPVVIREKNRVEMVEDIKRAQSMAETGNLAAARTLLETRAELLKKAAVATALVNGGGDEQHNKADYACLENEIAEITRRMATMEIYRTEGRAFALAGMSAHGLQRAATRGAAGPLFGSAPRSAMAPTGCAMGGPFGAASGPDRGGGVYGATAAAPDVFGCGYDTPGITQMMQHCRRKLETETKK